MNTDAAVINRWIWMHELANERGDAINTTKFTFKGRKYSLFTSTSNPLGHIVMDDLTEYMMVSRPEEVESTNSTMYVPDLYSAVNPWVKNKLDIPLQDYIDKLGFRDP